MPGAWWGTMRPGRLIPSLALFLFFSLFVSLSPASATPIGWKFSGVLGKAGSSILSLPANSVFEWVVNLNYAAPNWCDPASGQGFYAAIGSGSLRVGSKHWTGGQGTVEVNTIQGACGGPSPTGVSFRQSSWTSDDGFPFVPFTIIGSLNYPTRLGGAMPLLPPGEAIVTWIGVDPFEQFDVNTTVGSAAAPVPEPATLSLLGSGLILAAWRRRRGGRGTPERH